MESIKLVVYHIVCYLAVILAVINVNIIKVKMVEIQQYSDHQSLPVSGESFLNTKFNFITKIGFRKFFLTKLQIVIISLSDEGGMEA